MLPTLLLALAFSNTSLLPTAHAADWPDLGSVPLQRSSAGQSDAVVIVAIEDYLKVDDVTGARANADAWMRWFLQARGVLPSRVFKAFEGEATDLKMRELARKAAGAVQPGGTLWFVFIGHGAPSRDGTDGLLVGVDADRSADGIYGRSVSRTELLGLLGSGKQAQTVALLDACFSGQSASGQALVAGLQPLIPMALASTAPPARARVLTAAGSGEFAGPLPGASRPAFSYLALGGLMGWADVDGAGNRDGTVSASELREYVAGALNLTVSGRSQTPELLGMDAPLAKAVETKAPNLLAFVRSAVVEPPRSPEPASTGGAKGTSFKTPTLGGVEEQLREQTCADEARTKLSQQRERELAKESARVQAEGRAAWKTLASQGEACAKLSDKAARQPCLAAIDSFVATAKGASVELPAGSGSQVTACGPRNAADTTRSATVDLGAELAAAGELRARVAEGPAEGRDWQSPTLGTMKWIPAGTFMMGSPTTEPGRDNDETQHKVTLTKGFWMMEHEVTQGEWQAVMGSNPVATGSWKVGDEEGAAGSCASVGVGPNLPVVCVDWEQAREFARRVSARDGVTYALPTEAQWEYAARGGSSARWAGASEESALCGVANVANANRTGDYKAMSYDPSSWSFAPCDDGVSGLATVKRYRSNGYGLYDMSGNAWEWTADWLGDYPASAVIDPTGPSSGAFRVFRGGGWLLASHFARVAYRIAFAPADRGVDLGLRLVRTYP